MNALKRFYTVGAAEADRRVATALTPPPLEAVDRYLKASRFVTAIDGATLRLQEWWLASATKQLWSQIADRVGCEPLAIRRRAIAQLILIAVTAHVGLTLLQGAHAGWLWMMFPGMALVFAAVVLADSGTAGPED